MAVEVDTRGIPTSQERHKKKGWTRTEWMQIVYSFSKIGLGVGVAAGSYEAYASQFTLPPNSGFEDLCDPSRLGVAVGQEAYAKPQETNGQQRRHDTRQEAKAAPEPIVLLDPEHITADDLLIHKNVDIATNRVPNRKLLVLPVGYTQKEIETSLAKKVTSTFTSLPIELRSQVAIARSSSAIDYYTAKNGAMPLLKDVNQANQLVAAIEPFYAADDVAIIYKSDKASGGGEAGTVDMYPEIPGYGRMYAVLSGADDGYLKYRLVHEIVGHLQSKFEDDYTSGRVMVWWEPFVSTSLYNPAVPPIYRAPVVVAKDLDLPVRALPLRCGRTQLYEIEPDNPNNIMKNAYSDKDMDNRLTDQALLFNRLQRELISRSKTFTTIFEKPSHSSRR